MTLKTTFTVTNGEVQGSWLMNININFMLWLTNLCIDFLCSFHVTIFYLHTSLDEKEEKNDYLPIIFFNRFCKY